MKLPARLAARAEALQQRFRYSPTNMQQKAEANRNAFLNSIKAKAPKSIGKERYRVCKESGHDTRKCWDVHRIRAGRK